MRSIRVIILILIMGTFLLPCIAAISVPGQAPTLAAAILTATSTPNTIINLTANDSEHLVIAALSVNGNMTIQGPTSNSSGVTWSDTASGQPLQLGGALTNDSFTVQNLTIQAVNFAAGQCVFYNSTGASEGVTFNNVYFKEDNNSNAIRVSAVLLSTTPLFFNNCVFDGSKSYPSNICGFSSQNTTSGGVTFNSCEFIKFNGGAVTMSGTLSSILVSMNNCTIYSPTSTIGGIQVNLPVSINNCIIACPTPVNLSGTASASQFTNTSFQNAVAGTGSGCVTGISPSGEFVSVISQSASPLGNYHLSPSSKSLNLGVSIAGITSGNDADGVKWNNTTPSAGFYQYVIPPTRGYGGR